LADSLAAWWSENIWQPDAKGLPSWQRRIVLLLRGVQVLIGDLAEGKQNLYAMALVYKTLLSLVPLLAVMFSVLKGFGVHNELEPLLLNLMQPLGAQGVEVTENVLYFVDNTNVGALGAVGLGVLLFTVISMVQQIEVAFNVTWRVRQSRALAERFSHYISVLLVGPVLIFSAVGLSQTVKRHPLFQSALGTDTGAFLYNTLSVYLPFLMVVAAITFIYIFMPNTRVRPLAAVFGATVAALLFKGASVVFTMFIVGSTKYTAIYATFATMIILILWLFFIWLIVLLGSSVAYYFQHAEKLQFLQRKTGLTPHDRDQLTLQIMVLVTQRYYKGGQPLSVMKLSELLQVPDDIVEELVRNCISGHFLVEADVHKETLLPGNPPEETSVSSLLKYLRTSAGEGEKGPQINTDSAIRSVLDTLESHALDAISDINLKQLAAEAGTGTTR
jgi:membrane protein